MDSYIKEMENPVIIEKVIALDTNLEKDEIIDHLVNLLRKEGFVSINYCKIINKIKAYYNKIFKYGVIEIEVKELYGIKRLNVKVTVKNNFYSKHAERYILEIFLDVLDIKYKEV